MKPVLIIGASGQVAKALGQVLAGPNLSVSSSKPGSAYTLDLADLNSIRATFAKWNQQTDGVSGDVYLPGAWTAVDQCELDPDRSYSINVLGPEVVAQECSRYGHKLLFYSTEYVFGGAEYAGGAIGPFSETDVPAPTCVYGRHKLEAEQKIAAILPEALLVRTTVVFSYQPNGNNFAMQVRKTLLAAEPPAAKIRVALDQISTPTYAKALVEASLALMSMGQSGIFNVVGSDLISRPTFIKALAKTFGVSDEEVDRRFSFVPTAELNQTAKRPLRAGLTSAKVSQLGLKVWSLRDALDDLSLSLR
jgi:dTDP-4-dehydrorhamnose reductase